MEALLFFTRLNDRYALDGNDPNGFVGVLWSIAGIHDQVCSSKALRNFLMGLSLEMDLAFDDIYYSGRTLRRYINS